MFVSSDLYFNTTVQVLWKEDFKVIENSGGPVCFSIMSPKCNKKYDCCSFKKSEKGHRFFFFLIKMFIFR